MNTSHSKTPGAWRAVLFLFVIATLIPELLIGSTPLSRINQLAFQFPYYGSAALVIREAVIRFKLSRAGLLLLGLAFGVITEGLSLQSIFNPHFLNLDISYGRAAEVNWPWMLYMVGYHAVWSITIPVTLAGLCFVGDGRNPGLAGSGLGAFSCFSSSWPSPSTRSSSRCRISRHPRFLMSSPLGSSGCSSPRDCG